MDEAATLGAKGGPTAGGPTLTVLGAVSVQQGSGAAVAPRLDLGAETAPAQLSVVGAAHVACDKADAASGSLLVDRRLAVGDFDAGFVGELDLQGDARLDSGGGTRASSLVVAGLAADSGAPDPRPRFGGLRTIFHDGRGADAEQPGGASYLYARLPAEWADFEPGIYSETKRLDALHLELPEGERSAPSNACAVLTTYVDVAARLFQEARWPGGFHVRAAAVADAAWSPWVPLAVFGAPPT